jgi:hypothetical protein
MRASEPKLYTRILENDRDKHLFIMNAQRVNRNRINNYEMKSIGY